MSEGPYRIGFREDRHLGGHVTISLFVGRNVGARGRAGTIVLREEEWAEIRQSIEEERPLPADYIGKLGEPGEIGDVRIGTRQLLGSMELQQICGASDPSQDEGELLCNFEPGHDGQHSWEAA